MAIDAKTIVDQIDTILVECFVDDENADHLTFAQQYEFRTRLLSAIERYAPPNSVYLREVKNIFTNPEGKWWFIASILRAIRNDYEAGYIQSITELIHADVFSDFLEMADHLIEQAYKDPAAVIAGSVLEEHLRKLCDKNGIDVKKPDGTPKKADTLNSELAGVNVYSKLDQKNVTAWLDLRNKAAHGHYSEYTKDQVALLIQSVRDFITRNPA